MTAKSSATGRTVVPLPQGGGHRVRQFVVPPAAQLSPPPPCDALASVRTAGADGAILNVALCTIEDGSPEGARVVAVYADPDVADELDLAGARDLREQLAALLPQLDSMISALTAAPQRPSA